MHTVRTRRAAIVAAVAVVAATGVFLGVRALLRNVQPSPPTCQVGAGSAALVLFPEQAENATTIAVVARRMDLPDHAVTVALATALQESKLNNYPFGDRDSVGLFQQRPSQGWGRPDQLLTPSFAARAFFRHLLAVPRWQRLPVTAAAQSVQHSADGAGYAQWEEEARALARVLTGEVVPGMSCQFDKAGLPRAAALAALGRRELGDGVLQGRSLGGGPHSTAADWSVAQWLVSRARTYGITRVSVHGRTWTVEVPHWAPDAAATGAPTYALAPEPS
jgi:hypothetical protein